MSRFEVNIGVEKVDGLEKDAALRKGNLWNTVNFLKTMRSGAPRTFIEITIRIDNRSKMKWTHRPKSVKACQGTRIQTTPGTGITGRMNHESVEVN